MLALVTYWTLCPLSARPKLAPPELERFGAYFVLGALFALTTSRPRVLAVSLVGVGVGLEFAQLFVPGRDAAVPDADREGPRGARGHLDSRAREDSGPPAKPRGCRAPARAEPTQHGRGVGL
jgi:hypothetical protein